MIAVRNNDAGDDDLPSLEGAFATAMRFTPDRAAELHIDRAILQRYVEEEAAFGRIVVDGRGLTAGLRLHVLHPARQLLAEWRTRREEFETALGPKRATIDAVEKLDADLAALRNGARDELTKAVDTWRMREQNKVIERDWSDAQAKFDESRRRNEARKANMLATSPFYLLVLLTIGMADWLINYETFFAFSGVATVAAGATCIFAFLLSLGAHGHGEVLKQWSHRFYLNPHRPGRAGAVRLLGLATLAVAVVFLAAGWARYEADARTLYAQLHPALPGPTLIRVVNPVRDVVVTLFLNFGAWVVGVFVSYAAHDVDPEFMETTLQHKREGRRYNRARRSVTAVIERLEQQCSRQVKHLQVETLSRSAEVARERGLYGQILSRDRAVTEAIVGAATSVVQQYRDMLAQHVMARRSQVQIFLGGVAEHKELSPYDLMSLEVSLDNELVASPKR